MNASTNTVAGVSISYIERYLDLIECERGLSHNTLEAYHSDLKNFSLWLQEKSLTPEQAQSEDIHAYLSQRYDHKISARSNARLHSVLSGFYRYLLNEKIISSNPTHHLSRPKQPQPIPYTLSEDEVVTLLSAPDNDNPIGLRDRAMLELLYACGLRVSELVNLELQRLQLQQGLVCIIGKGDHERLVPMGDEAIHWVARYMEQSRPLLLNNKPDSDYVFISRLGKRMTRHGFWYNIKQYAIKANIKKRVFPHIVRHAFATHLINHGADLRAVQMLLGHSSLNTTQIYTHVAQARLKNFHQQYHPRG